MNSKHYPFHSLGQYNAAENDYARVMRVLGPRYYGSRDLIKQFVLDTTRDIYPPRSQHWLARVGRFIGSVL